MATLIPHNKSALAYPKIEGSTYKRLFNQIKPYWWAIGLAMLTNMFYSGVDATLTFLLKPLLDEGFIARDMSVIQLLPVILIGLFLVRGVVSFTATYLLAWAGRRIIMEFRQKVFKHLLALPTKFYDHHSSGQLISKLTFNVEQIAKVSTDVIATFVREFSLVVFLIVVVITISWQFSLLIFGAMPIIALMIYWVNKRFRRYSKRIQATMGGTTHIAEESIEGQKVVKIFNGEAYEQARFNEITQKNRNQEMRIVISGAINVPLVQLVAAMALAITVYFATSDTGVGGLSAGEFTALVVAMFAMLRPIKQLTNINNKIQQGLVAAQSVFELLDEPLEVDTGSISIKRAKGKIEYKDLSFSYDQSRGQVLNNINLTIEPGEVVAFVGRSGSGKTTLVNLLPRFYDVDQGKIVLDGTDISNIRLADLRRQIALVSQQVTLFNDTISSNIAYGMPEASEESIRTAALLSHCEEFVQHLPEGLNTLTGENGVLLSGGQRQRIAIARAILKDAPILILDEATSALDNESERHVQDALQVLMKNRTTLVIAHRLSTIERADKIVVLDQGSIVEMGTHNELIAKNGHYAALYQASPDKQFLCAIPS